MIAVAEVTEVLKDAPGLRCRFRDLVGSGTAASDFVRVLCPRMHTTGGASAWLPEVGELGVVVQTWDGTWIWLGSLPYLNAHQFDMTPGLAYLRHPSGLVVQVREGGDFELAHPSGLRITIAKEAGALPALKATSSPTTGDTAAPVVEVVHPSGATVEIDPEGNGKVRGFASLVFQDGEKRFSMEGLFDYLKDTLVSWAKSHTHTSASSGSPTSAPIQSLTDPAKDSCCSPASFKGPQGG